jgi:Fe-S-cluster containining protein
MQNISSENNLYSILQSESRKGSIEACKKCSGLVCCGIVEEGGIIEPPYLTKHDIKQIEYFTGLREEQFAVERENSVTGNVVFIMNTIENEGCIFFNKNKGKCEIYSFRPIDCRLFPLDCISGSKKKTDYYWALYKFERCKLNKKDLSSLLEYKEKAIRNIGDEIHDFATYPLPEMEKIGFKKLVKVKPLSRRLNGCVDNK